MFTREVFMFCPRCASEQLDDLKFCKSCGANLEAVRQVIDTREDPGKIDWSKTWVAEMFLSQSERKRREEEIERQRGITPEIKRRNEIKAGVITSCAGAGVAIFLYVLMQGIILSGHAAPGADAILSRLWVAGVIPIFVGLALIINGTLVSKKGVQFQGNQTEADPRGLKAEDFSPPRLGDSPDLLEPGFSVTERTTKHLGTAENFKRSKD
jgi:hypothetical protein